LRASGDDHATLSANYSRAAATMTPSILSAAMPWRGLV
jgi:hypothetical protein